MRIAIIGRSEILYNTALLLSKGHDIALIITAKEAPEYTKTSSDYFSLAKKYDIPFFQTSQIYEIGDFIRNLPQIDIGVSYNYSSIISQNIIDLFSLGILNAHAGDLPRYRGNACQAWAIINGEDRIGLCIYRMMGGELDCGDIIIRDYLPLNINTKITEVYQWMGRQIPKLYSEALERLKQNPDYVLERQSNNPDKTLRCYPRRPEDGRINWDKSAIEILRLINASNKPYSGAFCTFKGRKVIVWDAELAPEEIFLAIPGQITHIEEDFVDVATGNGKLRIKIVEYENKINPPSIFIKSIRARFH